MKLENLEVGMKIPNYRKLCELLEEPEKSGASKRAQISTWEHYVSFERVMAMPISSRRFTLSPS